MQVLWQLTWDSQSIVALSVSISAIESPALISSPTCTFHLAIFPAQAPADKLQ